MGLRLYKEHREHLEAQGALREGIWGQNFREAMQLEHH